MSDRPVLDVLLRLTADQGVVTMDRWDQADKLVVRVSRVREDGRMENAVLALHPYTIASDGGLAKHLTALLGETKERGT